MWRIWDISTSSSSTPTVTLENQFSDVETKTTSIAPSLEVPLVTGGSITLGPTFSSVESTSRSTEIFSGGTTDKSDSTDDSYGLSAGVALTQPLLRNAGVEYNQGSIVLAMYQERVADVRTRLAVVNLLYQVEQAYWSVYMSARTLEVQLSQYDLYKKELDDARKLRAGGVNTIADVYGFEAGVASQVARVVEADNQLRQSARAHPSLGRTLRKPQWTCPPPPKKLS